MSTRRHALFASIALAAVACSSSSPSPSSSPSSAEPPSSASDASGSASGYELCPDAATNAPECPATLAEAAPGTACTLPGYVVCGYVLPEAGVANGVDAQCHAYAGRACEGADGGAGTWQVVPGR